MSEVLNERVEVITHFWCRHTFGRNLKRLQGSGKHHSNLVWNQQRTGFLVEPTEDRISGDSLSEQAKKDSVCLLAELSKLIFRLMSTPFWVQTTCIRTCRFPCKDQKSSIAASAEQQRQEIESLREQSLEVWASVLQN